MNQKHIKVSLLLHWWIVHLDIDGQHSERAEQIEAETAESGLRATIVQHFGHPPCPNGSYSVFASRLTRFLVHASALNSNAVVWQGW